MNSVRVGFLLLKSKSSGFKASFGAWLNGYSEGRGVGSWLGGLGGLGEWVSGCALGLEVGVEGSGLCSHGSKRRMFEH